MNEAEPSSSLPTAAETLDRIELRLPGFWRGWMGQFSIGMVGAALLVPLLIAIDPNRRWNPTAAAATAALLICIQS
jgi:PPE-repeat protein